MSDERLAPSPDPAELPASALDGGQMPAPDAEAARNALGDARSLVIKIGSGVLVRDGTRFDRGTFCRLVEAVVALVERGFEICLVSSGAVALGRGRMGVRVRPDRERALPQLQALAAVGQTALMQLYDTELAHYGQRCGQVLLTRDDLDDRGRYLNARRTLRALLELGALPIINENDTVATDEIRFGDNDGLAARVAGLMDADLLVILSDVDAVYTANPRLDPTAARVAVRSADDPALDAMVGDTSNAAEGVGTGGMVTKLEAARIAARRSIPTLITHGKRPENVALALRGDDVGTLLLPSDARREQGRKAWIRSLRVRGTIRCDAGARRAVVHAGKSLLPSGVLGTGEGDAFSEGDAVAMVDANGRTFAVGLAAYSSRDIERIAGLQSSAISDVLGLYAGDVVVHRDDLVVDAAGVP